MTDIFLSNYSLASTSSLHHPPSFTSLPYSDGDTPFYAPSLIQDPSVDDLPSLSDVVNAFSRASVSTPSLHDHLPHSPSLTSLAYSEGDTASLYAPTLAQDPSIDEIPGQSDIIIAYVDPTSKVCIQN